MRLFALVFVTAIAQTAHADLTVFDVRKPIALSDKESPQKDFYINAGAESGLQSGMIITVVRKVPLYDTYQSRSAGDLSVPVAKVKIIYVQQGLAVARFYAEVPRADIPILEENFILIGDRLDLTTATHDKKSASNDEETPAAAPAAPVPAVAPAPAAKPPAAPPVSQMPEPTPAPAQITSQKIEASPVLPNENSPGVISTEGPTIR